MKIVSVKHILDFNFRVSRLKTFISYQFTLFLLLLFFIPIISLPAQSDTAIIQNDSTSSQQAIVPYQTNDSLISTDSVPKKPENFGLETTVKYKSFRKIHFNINERKVFLYDDAEIEYGEIKLNADYIEIDFLNNVIFARGVPDSTGKVQGTPVFSESGQTFDSEEMSYNFDTKKGIIKSVITKDGEGYLHGERIKKMPDDRINISHGAYTTCELKHPHFEFRYMKAQVIPNNKIVSGPAFMVIEGVPVPLVLPFGLFPNKTGQRSGIIIPAPGESTNRGFFLEGGGYYWGINDNMDLTVTGDIYSSGSWAIQPGFRYTKRYRYNGNMNFSYAKNIIGDKDDPDTEIKKDFSIRWSHTQDPKARPNGRFSANVNIVTAQYNEFNLTNTEAYLSNTFQSSISYQTNFNNNVFLSLNGTHQQNTIDRSVNITLPSLTLNTKQFYPFRRKKQIGAQKWYENVSVKYTVNADNRIQTKDTLLFKEGWLDDFKFGAKHSIPISSSIKLMKFFTLTNSVNYSEKWYPYTIRKSWNPDSLITQKDTIVGFVETDTVHGFSAAREFSYTASLNTRLYGMYQFKNFPIVAIRHVITPTISFSMRPDFGSEYWGYWDDYQINSKGDMGRYSIYDGLLYGGPADGKSGRISFSLGNNLEMKVRSKNDTLSGTKKVVLIDNFSISSAYDLAKDSLNFAPLTLSGRTTLFKKLNVNYSSSWDPYAVDSSGRAINEFEWNVNKKLFRMQSTSWNFSISYRLSAADLKKGKEKGSSSADEQQDLEQQLLEKYSEQEIRDVLDNPDKYINWNNPWSISFTYNLRFSNNPRYINYTSEDVRSTVNSIGISGDISITPKWKVNFRTGYDLVTKDFSYTAIDFYRDLHCWEMRFSWIPAGSRQSWTFGINVKASILKDLKYDRKKDFRDSY